MSTSRIIHFPALEIRQGQNRVLYSFAANGKDVHSFAAVSRIRRETEGGLYGYQRPEVLSHIAEIKRYLESADPMIPNAIVIAFDERVRFEPSTDSVNGGYCRPGTLLIPVEEGLPDYEKPGWIVDGQQRMAAIREATVETFPICITGFIAKDEQEQKEQFILVNSTKPLPKGLIYELLPTTDVELPANLQRKRLPATILERLNVATESPLFQTIQTPTTP